MFASMTYTTDRTERLPRQRVRLFAKLKKLGASEELAARLVFDTGAKEFLSALESHRPKATEVQER